MKTLKLVKKGNPQRAKRVKQRYEQSPAEFASAQERLANVMHAKAIHKAGGVTIGDVCPQLAELRDALRRLPA